PPTYDAQPRVRCPSKAACLNDPSLAGTDDIWVLDLATKKERRLVANDTAVWTGVAPRWSPDGRQIVFERCRRAGAAGLTCSVHVVGSEGTRPRRLFEGEAPVWSPDGREIAFVGSGGHGYADAVVRAHLDGSGRRVVLGWKYFSGIGL